MVTKLINHLSMRFARVYNVTLYPTLFFSHAWCLRCERICERSHMDYIFDQII